MNRHPLLLLGLGALALVSSLACRDRGSNGDGPTATVPATPTTAVTTPPVATPTGATRSTPTATAAAAASCLPAGVTRGQSSVQTLAVKGTDRSYRLYVPKSPSAPLAPVVLNFHGLGSSAIEQELYSGFIPLAEREGFILVSPDGTGSPRGWSVGGGLVRADDGAFVEALIETLTREVCADPARIYSTGLSNGAFFSSLLGCTMGDRIAAIAPVAGVVSSDLFRCKRSMPVLAFHGTEDAAVPYGGGNVLGIAEYAGVEKNASGWAATNPGASRAQCATVTSKDERLTEHVTARSYAGCSTEPVRLITIEGGGHTWPGSVDVPRLGPTTKEISASEMIWEFFEGERLP